MKKFLRILEKILDIVEIILLSLITGALGGLATFKLSEGNFHNALVVGILITVAIFAILGDCLIDSWLTDKES